MKWYAHTSDTKEWQTLKEHLENVAKKAEENGQKFNSGQAAFLIGLLHDVGKYTYAFQDKLKGKNNRIVHAIMGAKILQEYPFIGTDIEKKQQKFIADLLSYPIAGHHTGLPNIGVNTLIDGTLKTQLSKDVPDYNAYQHEINLTNINSLSNVVPRLDIVHSIPTFSCAFWVRMLYSCLVDADFLDTERFCNITKSEHRKHSSFNYEYADILHTHVNKKSTNCPQTSINQARKNIYSLCKETGKEAQGAFSLTVPTGGGKTLSSMAFALEHARKHKLDRIIYVIPYTSIIEQTANVFREIFGDEHILEHHCNFVWQKNTNDANDTFEETTYSMKLASENWESEIIITTSVQFFESLFSHKSSRCRKLHNFVNSIIIVDEAQMLPLNLLNPTILAMRELIANYKVSFLFCTATQPALSVLTIEETGKQLLKYGFAKGEIREIIPLDYLTELFELFKRTSILELGTLPITTLASKLAENKQALCIVNTKKQAQALYQNMPDKKDVFHLSTYMYPKHRKQVLENIREKLKNKEQCIVISTSLIECGVDISFPTVFRAYTGLDSIAQAAGRCNREGELEEGNVFLFRFEQELASKDSSLNRRINQAQNAYEKYNINLFSPVAIEDYFYGLYFYEDIENSKVLKEILDWRDSAFNFKDLSDEYYFIKESQIPIIIEPQNNSEEKEFFQKNWEKLRFSGMNRELRQFFQQYTVQVFNYELENLYTNGSIHLENDFYKASLGYDENIGLCPMENYAISTDKFIL